MLVPQVKLAYIPDPSSSVDLEPRMFPNLVFFCGSPGPIGEVSLTTSGGLH